ncbi:MAG: O-methyltransferase [Candidatus Hodarchaeales archaeon]|jgi:predicted O-methyltransferase YrrM
MLSEKIENILSNLEKVRETEIQKELTGEKIPTTERSLAIPRDEGAFLYILARSMKAKHILEIGTSFGYSTIWLAAAAKEENGKIISVDILPEKIKHANVNLKQAGLLDTVDLVLGDAKDVLSGITQPLDIVFLDADKRDYIEFIRLSLKKLRIGGIIFSDNVLDCPDIHKDDPEICEELMEFIRNHDKVSSVTIPFLPNGLEMTMKISD